MLGESIHVLIYYLDAKSFLKSSFDSPFFSTFPSAFPLSPLWLEPCLDPVDPMWMRGLRDLTDTREDSHTFPPHPTAASHHTPHNVLPHPITPLTTPSHTPPCPTPYTDDGIRVGGGIAFLGSVFDDIVSIATSCLPFLGGLEIATLILLPSTSN